MITASALGLLQFCISLLGLFLTDIQHILRCNSTLGYDQLEIIVCQAYQSAYGGLANDCSKLLQDFFQKRRTENAQQCLVATNCPHNARANILHLVLPLDHIQSKRKNRVISIHVRCEQLIVYRNIRDRPSLVIVRSGPGRKETLVRDAEP